MRTLLGAIGIGIALCYGANKPAPSPEPDYHVEVLDAEVKIIKLLGPISPQNYRELTIPAVYSNYTVKAISENFCKGITNITSITIPHTVEEIGEGFFAGSGIAGGGLGSISVVSSNKCYKVQDGCLFDSRSNKLIAFAGNGASVKIPTNVVDIARETFFGRQNLSEVRIPESVTNIGSQCFAFCPSLTNVVFYNTGNMGIGSNAFESCTGLASVYYCGNCPTVGDGSIYTDAAKGLASYVRNSEYVSGWGTVPGNWQNRALNFGVTTFSIRYSYDTNHVYAVKRFGEPLQLLEDSPFAKAGHKQRGWKFDAASTNLSEKVYEMGDWYTENRSTVLYPVWEYLGKTTVYFDKMGGEGEFKPFVAQIGVWTNIPSCTLTKSNYTFVGWSGVRHGKVNWVDGVEIQLGSNESTYSQTVYAVWVKTNCYAVAFNPNIDNAEWSMDYLQVETGRVAKLPPCKLTAPKDKQFAGWARSNPQGLFRRYDDQILIFNLTNVVNKVIELKAIWE